MAILPIRFMSVLRTASTVVAALLFVVIALSSAPSEAAPLGVSLSSIARLEEQIDDNHSIARVGQFGLSRYARHRRAEVARRRARVAQAVRIRNARAEFAHMQRKGQEFCLATAVYFEARDEPVAGQRAVAAVILARTKVAGRPKTVCGVVFEGSWRKTGCQFSFACDGRPDTPHWRERWIRAQRSAAYVWHHQRDTRGLVRGATFYHTKFVHPRWDKNMVRVARIGLHVFFRPRG